MSGHPAAGVDSCRGFSVGCPHVSPVALPTQAPAPDEPLGGRGAASRWWFTWEQRPIPYERHLVTAASYLVDYPFANRLYPGALDVLEKLLTWGQTVILSDGDVVFLPRKVYRSGIFEAVNGHVLIYVHKEEALADVERRYPADHYVMVDDKLRILAALKKAWGDRVTTVFPRQGKFANDPKLLAAFPDSADVSVARISDLLEYSLADLLKPTSLRNPK